MIQKYSKIKFAETSDAEFESSVDIIFKELKEGKYSWLPTIFHDKLAQTQDQQKEAIDAYIEISNQPQYQVLFGKLPSGLFPILKFSFQGKYKLTSEQIENILTPIAKTVQFLNLKSYVLLHNISEISDWDRTMYLQYALHDFTHLAPHLTPQNKEDFIELLSQYFLLKKEPQENLIRKIKETNLIRLAAVQTLFEVYNLLTPTELFVKEVFKFLENGRFIKAAEVLSENNQIFDQEALKKIVKWVTNSRVIDEFFIDPEKIAGVIDALLDKHGLTKEMLMDFEVFQYLRDKVMLPSFVKRGWVKHETVMPPATQKAYSQLRSFLKEKETFVNINELRKQSFFNNSDVKQFLLKEHPKGLSFEDLLHKDMEVNGSPFVISEGSYPSYQQSLYFVKDLPRKTFILLFEDMAKLLGFKDDPGFKEYQEKYLSKLQYGEHNIGTPGNTFGWALYKKIGENTYFIEQIQTDLNRLVQQLKSNRTEEILGDYKHYLENKYGKDKIAQYERSILKTVKNYFEVILSAFLQEFRGAKIYISSPEIIKETAGEKAPVFEYQQIPPKFNFQELKKFEKYSDNPVWYKYNAKLNKLSLK